MNWNFNVNYTDASGVRTAKMYVNQTAANVVALVQQYTADQSITKVSFQAQEVAAQAQAQPQK